VRREPEHFGEQEMDLLYIAKKLKHALALEAALDGAGLDYAVEVDEYQGGIIFRSVRQGAFFYVLPGDLEAARRVVQDAGFTPFEPV